MRMLFDRPARARAKSILAVCLCLSFLGCESVSRQDDLPFQDTEAFTRTNGVELTERWWHAFDDPRLSERIESALAANYDLAVAWERIHAARALARRTASDRYPDLDATAGLVRRESLTSDDDATDISLGLAASYEVDLWGRIDSLAKAEALRAAATQSDYRAAAISLSSSVSLTWYQLAQTLVQLDLVQSQLEINQTFLDLLQERFDAGLIRSADLLRQRQLVEATREQAIVLRLQLEVLEHQLAILEGRPPQAGGDLPPAELPELPEAPSAGLPSTLLTRRPDVRAALTRVQAADKDLAAAISDKYPRLNLSASLETFAERPADLFEDWLFSIAANAVAPLLDGGEREAEIERNEALRRQRVAEYGQTVLIAFQEVEDALAQEARQAERIASLREQLRLAEQSVEQLQTQFLNGVGDYLAVLTASRDKQQLERDVVAARLDLIAFRIALYRALAGGFETPREREAVDAPNGPEPEHE